MQDLPPADLIARLKRHLTECRTPSGIWKGHLSSSALATAVAIGALSSLDRKKYAKLIDRGLSWLCDDLNSDGGWGDTPDSNSNLAATILGWSALSCAGSDGYGRNLRSVEEYLGNLAGGTDGRCLSKALKNAYGADRTFAVPILSFAAALGSLGGEGWKYVKQLPFELGGFSHRVLKYLHLPVVSYALPALIAIGQAKHHHRPSAWPFQRILRNCLKSKTLRKLREIQPHSGGFLEAIPLTGFVAVALASMGLADHPVAEHAGRFLVNTARDNGSWPIDTDLSTWVTTSTVNAFGEDLPAKDADIIRRYLLNSQLAGMHPFTQAQPGGWAWTDLSGGVPDADDTSSALLALAVTGAGDDNNAFVHAMIEGVKWLCRLQNRDGGWPTFCRGWGKLPFDRSAPELTAHAISALSACGSFCSPVVRQSAEKAIHRGIAYLYGSQKADGSFIPLWFGNEKAPRGENPVYGTARVIKGLMSIESPADARNDIVGRSVAFLMANGCENGGWGAIKGLEPTVEETAVAVEALALAAGLNPKRSQSVLSAVDKGIRWLAKNTENATRFAPAPIGLYFARLWYSEAMYPPVFMLSALRAAVSHR